MATPLFHLKVILTGCRKSNRQEKYHSQKVSNTKRLNKLGNKWITFNMKMSTKLEKR